MMARVPLKIKSWVVNASLTVIRNVTQYPKYSIVIPAYNESARIPATLRSVVGHVRAQGWVAEVIVVNDGSRDTTAQVSTLPGKAPKST